MSYLNIMLHMHFRGGRIRLSYEHGERVLFQMYDKYGEVKQESNDDNLHRQ